MMEEIPILTMIPETIMAPIGSSTGTPHIAPITIKLLLIIMKKEEKDDQTDTHRNDTRYIHTYTYAYAYVQTSNGWEGNQRGECIGAVVPRVCA